MGICKILSTKIVLLVGLFLISNLQAVGALQLHLRWQDSKLEMVSSKHISGKFKHSKNDVVGGVASQWSYQLKDKDGRVLKEVRFTDPTKIHIPSPINGSASNQQVRLDSTDLFLTVPLAQGSERIQFVLDESGDKYIAGTRSLLSQNRSIKVLGNFEIGEDK